MLIKWIKKLLRVNLQCMESQEKVNAWVTWLNNLTPGQIWIPVNGYNMMPTAQQAQAGWVFNPNVGFIVKAFQNTTTGEVRCFSFNFFEG